VAALAGRVGPDLCRVEDDAGELALLVIGHDTFPERHTHGAGTFARDGASWSVRTVLVHLRCVSVSPRRHP
jgi:hypothetical protein